MNAYKNKPYVIVGMSGGVDSSVAALTLLQQGYRVEGLFMKNWEEDDDTAYCTAADDLEDAKDVCDTLEIPLHSVNFSKEYWDRVFQYFIDEYEAGRTPNPDILCNKEIKFKAFLDYALKLGADKIATGHYARLGHNDTGYQLLKGIDNNKDQSYFLHALTQTPLSKALFPIGEMQKDQVRALAQSAGFVTHNKKDSTGICFIGERKFKDFLSNYVSAKKGDIITPEGRHIGTHNGLMFYTLGQRQGLGIGGMQNSSDEPWYVLDKNISNNTLIVDQGHDHPLLFKSSLVASQLTWVSGKTPELPLQCDAKIRYRQACQACTIVSTNQDKTLVEFNQPQRAITPGQSIVFYMDDECLGGGIIE